MKQAGDSADNVISELLGNNVRTKQAFLNLANAGDLLRNSINRGNKAFEKNIALQEEASLRYQTRESQLKILTNQFREQQNVLGEQLIPSFVTLEKVKLNLLK